MFSARIAFIVLTLCVLALSSLSAQGSNTLVKRLLKKAKGAPLPPKEAKKGKTTKNDKNTKKGKMTKNGKPSDSPSDSPSDTPSDVPSTKPSDSPSDSPSILPSALPSVVPSKDLSSVPSELPSYEPSQCVNEISVDDICIGISLTNCNPLQDDWVGIYSLNDSLDTDSMPNPIPNMWHWTCGSTDCMVAVKQNFFFMPNKNLSTSGTYLAFLFRNSATPYVAYAVSAPFVIGTQCPLV